MNWAGADVTLTATAGRPRRSRAQSRLVDPEGRTAHWRARRVMVPSNVACIRGVRRGCVLSGPPPHCPPPYSLIVRPAFLAKGGDALLEVRARPHAVTELLLERLARERVLGDRRADLALHRLHGRGAVRGDHLGGLERPGHESFRWNDAVHEPQARGLGRVDELAGQQEIHGVDVADLLDELH